MTRVENEMKIHCLYDKLVPVGELRCHPKNRNKHPEEQVDRLAKILKYQGWRYPIKVSNRSGYITSGHGRLEAAGLNEWSEVPVNFQDYESDEQEYADVQADNAIASWAELDLAALNADLADLGPDFDIDLLGIRDFVIEPADKLPPGCDEDEVPEHVEPITKLGDLYRLGNHRLLCGDSTQIDSVDKLMNGEKADMVFTDPPYNIAYKGGSKKREEIKNDDLVDFYQFLLDIYACALIATKPGAAAYVTHADTERVNFTKAFVDAGFHLSSVIIWKKNNSTFGRQDYFWKHEPMLYGWNSSGSHQWYGPNTEDTAWEIDRPSKSEDHPTMKPIPLVERALGNSSKAGDGVLDLFGGSGSTLIACEKTNRKCFMMELDPHYCDVIVARWEKYTGKKSEIVNA